MYSTPQVERFRRAANRLHDDLRSANAARAHAAAQRFLRLRTYRGWTVQIVLEHRTTIQLKHARAVIAEEAGFRNWDALVRVFAVQEGPSGTSELLQLAATRWITRHSAVLEAAGLLRRSGDGVLASEPLLAAVCSALLEAGVDLEAGTDDTALDPVQVASDTMLALFRAAGPLPVDVPERSPFPLSACAPLLADGVEITSQTWCYATPGDGTAHRLPAEFHERLQFGICAPLDPNWLAADGGLYYKALVVLLIDGVARFIERAECLAWRIPVLYVHPQKPLIAPIAEEATLAAMRAFLSDAGVSQDQAVALLELMPHPFGDLQAPRLESRLLAVAHAQDHAALVERAPGPQRDRVLWDLIHARLVVPGIPLSGSLGSDLAA